MAVANAREGLEKDKAEVKLAMAVFKRVNPNCENVQDEAHAEYKELIDDVRLLTRCLLTRAAQAHAPARQPRAPAPTVSPFCSGCIFNRAPFSCNFYGVRFVTISRSIFRCTGCDYFSINF